MRSRVFACCGLVASVGASACGSGVIPSTPTGPSAAAAPGAAVENETRRTAGESGFTHLSEKPGLRQAGPADEGETTERGITVTPITALFQPELFKTTYSVTIRNPHPEAVFVVTTWLVIPDDGAPECGRWGPQEAQEFFMVGPNIDGRPDEVSVSMEWEHPHPPCAEVPDHLDTLIGLDVNSGPQDLSSVLRFSCIYRGAASGEGPHCLRVAVPEQTLPRQAFSTRPN